MSDPEIVLVPGKQMLDFVDKADAVIVQLLDMPDRPMALDVALLDLRDASRALADSMDKNPEEREST